MSIDIPTIFSSLGISAAGAWWVARKILSNQFDQRLAKHKENLTRETEREKALLAGAVRKEVEAAIAERAASLNYEWEARKRLYKAIGPLRFQLLMASRDMSSRVASYPQRRFATTTTGYYGASMLFTILHPIVLADLIEQQVAYTDFAVDPDAIHLLQFKKACYATLTGGLAIGNHPNADWNRQVEHLFYGTLSAASNTLFVEDGDLKRCARFDECNELLKASGTSMLDPLRGILDCFTIDSHPLFWCRLVCLGFVCTRLIAEQGARIGFEERPYDTKALLTVSNDQWIRENIDRILNGFEKLVNAGL